MGLSVDRCISDRLKSIDYTREEHLFFWEGQGGGVILYPIGRITKQVINPIFEGV